MEQTTLECPSCGHTYTLLVLDPSPNGAVPATQHRHGAARQGPGPPEPVAARTRRRSPYHAFIAEQRRAGKSMKDIQAAWKKRKAEAEA